MLHDYPHWDTTPPIINPIDVGIFSHSYFSRENQDPGAKHPPWERHQGGRPVAQGGRGGVGVECLQGGGWSDEELQGGERHHGIQPRLVWGVWGENVVMEYSLGNPTPAGCGLWSMNRHLLLLLPLSQVHTTLLPLSQVHTTCIILWRTSRRVSTCSWTWCVCLSGRTPHQTPHHMSVPHVVAPP